MNTRWLSLGLTLLGVSGVGATAWLSVRCSRKADKVQGRKEKILAYLPAIISGVGTSACIVGSHRVSRKEIAALTASCAYLTANRDKIEQKARKLLGDEKFKQIKTETTQEIVKERKYRLNIEDTGYGKIRFVETMFGREFYCSKEHVDWAEKHLNYLYNQGERVNYNTFYELLGLRKTKDGWMNGWPDNEDIYGYSIETPIYFENTKMTDEETGEICWLIDCRTTPPVQNYLELEQWGRETRINS